MKGLNIRKLAAIAVGGALVGSALVPLAAAINVDKADVVGASGSPVVSVVAGTNAAASDFVWAGNIAAKVAQLATVESSVTGGTGTATPTDLSVDLAVGGSSSYSTEYAKTYDGTSYPLDNDPASDDIREFVKSATHGQLPFLTNETKSYRHDGSSYNISVKDNVGIEAQVDFDTVSTVKDLVAYLKTGDFNYVLDLGNGIPCSGTGATGTFTDGDSDNIVIPFLGDEYTVQECDTNSTVKEMKLIKESSKTNYNEGDTIPGLTGRGDYAGQEMSVKIAAVTQTSSTATYQARFELYDPEGNLIDSQTVSSGVYLNESFLDSEGAYALETVVYLSEVNVEPTTSKGVITMVIGKNVVTVASGKQYPYDSTDTVTSDDYWIASFTTTDTAAAAPKVKKLTQLTIQSNVQIWDTTNPLWSANDSLTQAGQDAADAGGDTAHFLQGEESGLGYDFVKVKFDGFKYDQDKAIIKIGDNELTYTDNGGEKRNIPFYIRIGTPSGAATEQTLYLDEADFFAKCYKSGQYTIDVYDGNYLNGAVFNTEVTLDTNNVATDNGKVAVGGAGLETTIDLNGVQYSASYLYTAGEDNNGVRLTVDGNCSFTKTTDDTDYVNPLGGGVNTTNTLGKNRMSVQSAFFDDDNANRYPGDAPIHFLEQGVLEDTYKYRLYYSSTDDAVYLLLDSGTNFSNEVAANVDVNFIATDISEQGSTGAGSFADDVAPGNYLPFYWPDLDGFGNDTGDTVYLAGIFGVQADSGVGWDFTVHVNTATGNLIQYPNDEWSNYTTDVNAVAANNPLWQLRSRTDIESALHAGYLEYGTVAELTDDLTTATFTIPEAQIYLSMSILGEGAVTTVEGGETVEGVKQGETVTIAGKDISVSAINYTAGTCTIADVTYPRLVSVGQLVYTDSPAPAGNRIIVGGYLVNKLAENVLLGDGSTLQEALNAPGDRVAEVLSSGDIVVAGYTGPDTKAAAQELIAALDMLV